MTGKEQQPLSLPGPARSEDFTQACPSAQPQDPIVALRLLHDAVGALPARPYEISHVQGPYIEVARVEGDPGAVDVRVVTGFRAHYKDPRFQQQLQQEELANSPLHRICAPTDSSPPNLGGPNQHLIPQQLTSHTGGMDWSVGGAQPVANTPFAAIGAGMPSLPDAIATHHATDMHQRLQQGASTMDLTATAGVTPAASNRELAQQAAASTAATLGAPGAMSPFAAISDAPWSVSSTAPNSLLTRRTSTPHSIKVNGQAGSSGPSRLPGIVPCAEQQQQQQQQQSADDVPPSGSPSSRVKRASDVLELNPRSPRKRTVELAARPDQGLVSAWGAGHASDGGGICQQGYKQMTPPPGVCPAGNAGLTNAMGSGPHGTQGLTNGVMGCEDRAMVLATPPVHAAQAAVEGNARDAGALLVLQPNGQVLSMAQQSPQRAQQGQVRSEWEISDMAQISIVRRLAVGGFSEVFLGRYQGTLVAVKRLIADHTETLSRFAHEVRVLMRLRHPNLILFMGYALRPEPCIVSEYMSRGSLYSILRSRSGSIGQGSAEGGTDAASLTNTDSGSNGSGSKPPELKLQKAVAVAVARGMAYLHTRNPPILHLDLKSPNILVDNAWRIKIADFGLSITRQHTYVSSGAGGGGTPEWMAPEVLRCERYDEKADVYSYGVVLWEMLTGQVPWGDLNAMQVVGAVGFSGRCLPPPMSGDPFLRDLCARCLRLNPVDRPSFPEIVAQLDSQWGGEGTGNGNAARNGAAVDVAGAEVVCGVQLEGGGNAVANRPVAGVAWMPQLQMESNNNGFRVDEMFSNQGSQCSQQQPSSRLQQQQQQPLVEEPDSTSQGTPSRDSHTSYPSHSRDHILPQPPSAPSSAAHLPSPTQHIAPCDIPSCPSHNNATHQELRDAHLLGPHHAVCGGASDSQQQLLESNPATGPMVLEHQKDELPDRADATPHQQQQQSTRPFFSVLNAPDGAGGDVVSEFQQHSTWHMDTAEDVVEGCVGGCSDDGGGHAGLGQLQHATSVPEGVHFHTPTMHMDPPGSMSSPDSKAGRDADGGRQVNVAHMRTYSVPLPLPRVSSGTGKGSGQEGGGNGGDGCGAVGDSRWPLSVTLPGSRRRGRSPCMDSPDGVGGCGAATNLRAVVAKLSYPQHTPPSPRQQALLAPGRPRPLDRSSAPARTHSGASHNINDADDAENDGDTCSKPGDMKQDGLPAIDTLPGCDSAGPSSEGGAVPQGVGNDQGSAGPALPEHACPAPRMASGGAVSDQPGVPTPPVLPPRFTPISVVPLPAAFVRLHSRHRRANSFSAIARNPVLAQLLRSRTPGSSIGPCCAASSQRTDNAVPGTNTAGHMTDVQGPLPDPLPMSSTKPTSTTSHTDLPPTTQHTHQHHHSNTTTPPLSPSVPSSPRPPLVRKASLPLHDNRPSGPSPLGRSSISGTGDTHAASQLGANGYLPPGMPNVNGSAAAAMAALRASMHRLRSAGLGTSHAAHQHLSSHLLAAYNHYAHSYIHPHSHPHLPHNNRSKRRSTSLNGSPSAAKSGHLFPRTPLESTLELELPPMPDLPRPPTNDHSDICDTCMATRATHRVSKSDEGDMLRSGTTAGVNANDSDGSLADLDAAELLASGGTGSSLYWERLNRRLGAISGTQQRRSSAGEGAGTGVVARAPSGGSPTRRLGARGRHRRVASDDAHRQFYNMQLQQQHLLGSATRMVRATHQGLLDGQQFVSNLSTVNSGIADDGMDAYVSFLSMMPMMQPPSSTASPTANHLSRVSVGSGGSGGSGVSASWDIPRDLWPTMLVAHGSGQPDMESGSVCTDITVGSFMLGSAASSSGGANTPASLASLHDFTFGGPSSGYGRFIQPQMSAGTPTGTPNVINNYMREQHSPGGMGLYSSGSLGRHGVGGWQMLPARGYRDNQGGVAVSVLPELMHTESIEPLDMAPAGSALPNHPNHFNHPPNQMITCASLGDLAIFAHAADAAMVMPPQTNNTSHLHTDHAGGAAMHPPKPVDTTTTTTTAPSGSVPGQPIGSATSGPTEPTPQLWPSIFATEKAQSPFLEAAQSEPFSFSPSHIRPLPEHHSDSWASFGKSVALHEPVYGSSDYEGAAGHRRQGSGAKGVTNGHEGAGHTSVAMGALKQALMGSVGGAGGPQGQRGAVGVLHESHESSGRTSMSRDSEVDVDVSSGPGTRSTGGGSTTVYRKGRFLVSSTQPRLHVLDPCSEGDTHILHTLHCHSEPGGTPAPAQTDTIPPLKQHMSADAGMVWSQSAHHQPVHAVHAGGVIVTPGSSSGAGQTMLGVEITASVPPAPAPAPPSAPASSDGVTASHANGGQGGPPTGAVPAGDLRGSSSASDIVGPDTSMGLPRCLSVPGPMNAQSNQPRTYKQGRFEVVESSIPHISSAPLAIFQPPTCTATPTATTTMLNATTTAPNTTTLIPNTNTSKSMVLTSSNQLAPTTLVTTTSTNSSGKLSITIPSPRASTSGSSSFSPSPRQPPTTTTTKVGRFTVCTSMPCMDCTTTTTAAATGTGTGISGQLHSLPSDVEMTPVSPFHSGAHGMPANPSKSCVQFSNLPTYAPPSGPPSTVPSGGMSGDMTGVMSGPISKGASRATSPTVDGDSPMLSSAPGFKDSSGASLLSRRSMGVLISGGGASQGGGGDVPQIQRGMSVCLTTTKSKGRFTVTEEVRVATSSPSPPLASTDAMDAPEMQQGRP